MRPRRGQFKHKLAGALKHTVDVSSSGANFNAFTNASRVYISTENPVSTSPDQVKAGSRVRGIKFDINIANSDAVGTLQIFDWYLFFDKQNTLSLPDPRSAGTSPLKANVLIQGMEMIYAGTPTKRHGYVKIPPKFQKLDVGDEVYLVYQSRLNLGATDSFCFKAIFKEISP